MSFGNLVSRSRKQNQQLLSESGADNNNHHTSKNGHHGPSTLHHRNGILPMSLLHNHNGSHQYRSVTNRSEYHRTHSNWFIRCSGISKVKIISFVVLSVAMYSFADKYYRFINNKSAKSTLLDDGINHIDQSGMNGLPNDLTHKQFTNKELIKRPITESQENDRRDANGDHGPQNREEQVNIQIQQEKVRQPKKASNDDDTEILPDSMGKHEEPNVVDGEHIVRNIPKTITPKGFAFTTADDFSRHRTMSEAVIKQDATILRKYITAYAEPPLNDIIPNTGSRGDLHDVKDRGIPPDFIIPLPRRKHSPDDLIKIEYPNVQTCHDMPGKFPIDRGLEINEMGDVVVWNVGNKPTPPNFGEVEAPYCPVELDPFLPWIHDVFPSQDGSRIEFIAQNKRRCRTGSEYTENVNRLIPQVTLMQSVSVEKISDKAARKLAPDLWHPENSNDQTPDDSSSTTDETPRYRLAPYEEASSSGMYTRFICRFHMTTAMGGVASVTVILGETLSEYPFNYEYINYRKAQKSFLSPKGKDTLMFWTSNLRFSCPLPENTALRQAIALGKTVLSDGTPTVHLDVIPIRTSVRYDELHLTEDMIGPKSQWQNPIFDPIRRWGKDNVLPRVEASGRWTNIPICLPPELVDQQTVHTETDVEVFDTTATTRKFIPNIAELSPKPHYLAACIWASAAFKTRGKDKGASTDTIERLQEWIEFHLLVGFDHIYVYDNSGANTNETTLESTLSRYPGKVTRIDWPSIVCNNNIPAHDSCGERSSQYAAENSCRTRYGPFTEWLAAFDTDEYFVPMGNYTNLKDVLKDVGDQGTNILSLRSSRGRLRQDKSVSVTGMNSDAKEKAPDATFLEAYNCDSAGSPKPSWAERARKQIYRPEYVLYHFVHYSTVTRGYLQTYNMAQENVETWYQHYRERSPTERPSDELSEVVMVHTKSLGRDMTFNYNTTCRYDYDKKWQGCWVAYPFPTVDVGKVKGAHDENGMEYNCYINRKVEDYWIPKLREALVKRKSVKFSKLADRAITTS